MVGAQWFVPAPQVTLVWGGKRVVVGSVDLHPEGWQPRHRCVSVPSGCWHRAHLSRALLRILMSSFCSCSM